MGVDDGEGGCGRRDVVDFAAAAGLVVGGETVCKCCCTTTTNINSTTLFDPQNLKNREKERVRITTTLYHYYSHHKNSIVYNPIDTIKDRIANKDLPTAMMDSKTSK